MTSRDPKQQGNNAHPKPKHILPASSTHDLTAHPLNDIDNPFSDPPACSAHPSDAQPAYDPDPFADPPTNRARSNCLTTNIRPYDDDAPQCPASDADAMKKGVVVGGKGVGKLPPIPEHVVATNFHWSLGITEPEDSLGTGEGELGEEKRKKRGGRLKKRFGASKAVGFLKRLLRPREPLARKEGGDSHDCICSA